MVKVHLRKKVQSLEAETMVINLSYSVEVKIGPIGTRTQILSLSSQALWTLFIALSFPFHYKGISAKSSFFHRPLVDWNLYIKMTPLSLSDLKSHLRSTNI